MLEKITREKINNVASKIFVFYGAFKYSEFVCLNYFKEDNKFNDVGECLSRSSCFNEYVEILYFSFILNHAPVDNNYRISMSSDSIVVISRIGLNCTAWFAKIILE